MNYKEAVKTIESAASGIVSARAEFADAVAKLSSDKTLSDYGRSVERENASDKMFAAVDGLPEAIEAAADVINAAVDAYNKSFDYKNADLRDAIMFAQFPDLPDEAVTSMLKAAKSPSEARYLSGVLSKSGNDNGAAMALERADALVAGRISNASDAWFVANETGTDTGESKINRIVAAARGAAESISGADSAGADE